MANPYPAEITRGGVVSESGSITFTDPGNQPGGSLPAFVTAVSTPGVEALTIAGKLVIDNPNNSNAIQILKPDLTFTYAFEMRDPTGNTNNAFDIYQWDTDQSTGFITTALYQQSTHQILSVTYTDGTGIYIDTDQENPALQVQNLAGDVTKFAIGAAGFLDMLEQTEPAAPAANNGRLFVKDTGGKSQLLVRFPSGSSQVIATEP